MNAFEYGGGGSTIFFASRGLRVTTVEHSADWCNRIYRELQLRGLLDRVTVLHIQDADEYVNAIKQSGPHDCILVDGIEEDGLRVKCVRAAALCSRQGMGILILDDAWQERYEVVPRVLSDWRRFEFVGLGPARLGVTRTDVYLQAPSVMQASLLFPEHAQLENGLVSE
jgi:predicted O-methyltransferase YrrM